MSMTTQPSRFVTRVRAEMDAQRLSMRGLARRIDPGNVERARRNLIRWMYEGIQPGRANRIEVAAALGIEPSELEDDADADQGASLDALLERRVRALIDERLRQIAS